MCVHVLSAEVSVCSIIVFVLCVVQLCFFAKSG